jgi:hypothetical protein
MHIKKIFMKKVLTIFIILIALQSIAQVSNLKPCKIIYMPMRMYGPMYRDNDSLKNILNAIVQRGNDSEMKGRGVLVINGYYKDSSGVRYYFAQDKSPLATFYAKILKTVP